MIPLCVPEIRGNEWKYISECLDTNWVSSVDPFVDRFERELADYVGTKYVVATCNGTAALHIALLVAGVQPDDEVLVFNSHLHRPGRCHLLRRRMARPHRRRARLLADGPAESGGFSGVKSVNGGMARPYNKTTGRRVKAVLPVHILGHPVDMVPIALPGDSTLGTAPGQISY